MNYEDKKIVAIIATNVDARTAMNVIGHLAISIGKYSDNEIMGKKELIDNSGISHLGISKFPFIVTKVKVNKLKKAISLARQNPNIMVADYPKEMLETRTDEELIEAINTLKNDIYMQAFNSDIKNEKEIKENIINEIKKIEN